MSLGATIAQPWTVPAAVGAALFLWWFSTGALFWISRLGVGRGGEGPPRPLLQRVVSGAVLCASLAALGALAGRTAVHDAYLSFAVGLMAWAVVEYTFLTGLLTGPIARRCPPGLGGWQRFAMALGTLLWHEVAILGTGAAMLAITWQAPNQVGTWTFLLLMAMRISAKLNLFLGVPYPPAALLPGPLAHLESYFRVRPFTALLPFAVTSATALATVVAWRAATPGLDAFYATGYALFWTLLVLGIIEHWFLILPLREAALWSWFTGLPARERAGSRVKPSDLVESRGVGPSMGDPKMTATSCANDTARPVREAAGHA
ncbi:MAG: putative photosynthetic complex assembly protein PuhE [Pseudomonadota bacterium]